MAVAPLPRELPGVFFILVWEKDNERFILHTDDIDGSSYDMGNNLSFIALQLRLWGYAELAGRTIDTAREYGAVQVIPSQDRIIALFDREKLKVDVFDKENEHATYAYL